MPVLNSAPRVARNLTCHAPARRNASPGLPRAPHKPSGSRAMPPVRSPPPSKRGRRSPHDLHLVGLDFKDDPDLVRLGPGILVLAQVFLGEGIDMRVCT